MSQKKGLLDPLNCAFWPPLFQFDPKICQAACLISVKQGSHDPNLENPKEIPGEKFDAKVWCTILSRCSLFQVDISLYCVYV